MSNEIRKPENNKENKPAKKISEENLQLIANLIITTVSTAALMASILVGSKGRRR